MKLFLNTLEFFILSTLVALLAKGVYTGDLKMIVPATVVLLTLGPLVAVNFVRDRFAKMAPAADRAL